MLIESIIVFLLIGTGLLFGISWIMMLVHLWRFDLPKTELVRLFFFSWKFYPLYVQKTREEFGHVGIWLKIMIASLVLFMSIILTLALA